MKHQEWPNCHQTKPGDSWPGLTALPVWTILVSRDGKSIRFKNPMSDQPIEIPWAQISKKLDYIISMESFDPEEPVAKDKRSKIFRDILMVTEFSLVREPSQEYPVQNDSCQA